MLLSNWLGQLSSGLRKLGNRGGGRLSADTRPRRRRDALGSSMPAMIEVLEPRRVMSAVSFWDTPAGISIQDGFDDANAAYQQALTDSTDTQTANDQLALDGFNSGVAAAENALSIANQAAVDGLAATASAAADAFSAAVGAAELAFSTGAQAASATNTAAVQSAEDDFNSAEQAAIAAQSTANQTAEDAINAAKQSATNAMNASIVGAAATFIGISDAADVVYRAAVLTAQQAYASAISTSGGSPITTTTPFDSSTDATYQVDIAAAVAASGTAHSAAQSAYDAAVSAAQAAADAALAPINATLQSAIASNQASFATAAAAALSSYDSAVAGHQSTYQSAVAAAEVALFTAQDASELAYEGAVNGATNAFNVAVASSQNTLDAAVSTITNGLATTVATNQSAFNTAKSGIDAAFLAAHVAASSDYYDVINDPASTVGDINDATNAYNAAMLSATTSQLSDLTGILVSQINADSAAASTAADAFTSASTARKLADIAAAQAKALIVNAACTAVVLSDAAAITAYRMAIDGAVASESQAISGSAADCDKTIGAAAVVQVKADASAANTAAIASAPIFADREKALADAKADRGEAFASADADYFVSVTNALATAIGRWAATESSPDATLDAALFAADAAKQETCSPAYGDYMGAMCRAMAQWVTDMAPAAMSYASDLSSNALTAFNSIAGASQTADEATVDAALAYEITSSNLGQALGDAEAGAAEALISSIAPAVEGVANAQAGNAATAKGTVASLTQTLVDTETDNATAKISSDTSAVIALSSAQVMLLTALAADIPTFASTSPTPIVPPIYALPLPPLYGPPSTGASSVFQAKKQSSEALVLGNAEAIRAFAESLLPKAKVSNQDIFQNYTGLDIGAFAADHQPELWAQALSTVDDAEDREQLAQALNIGLGAQGSTTGLGRNREAIASANAKWQDKQRTRMLRALAEYIRLLKQAGDGNALLALKRFGARLDLARPGGGASAADIEAAFRAKLEPPLISPF